MLLLIATIIAIIYAIIKPFSNGLYDASLWAAKIMMPEDTDEIVDSKMAKHLLRVNQAVLMDGWPSNFPFLNNMLPFTSMIIGFIYSWWGGFLMYFISVLLAGMTRFFFTQPATYYLMLLSHRITNRIANYKIMKDLEREKAAIEFSDDLQEIIITYRYSQLKPPTTTELKSIPYGDMNFWLNLNNSK